MTNAQVAEQFDVIWNGAVQPRRGTPRMHRPTLIAPLAVREAVVFAALKTTATRAEVSARTGLTYSQTVNTLWRLIRKGVVVNVCPTRQLGLYRRTTEAAP